MKSLIRRLSIEISLSVVALIVAFGLLGRLMTSGMAQQEKEGIAAKAPSTSSATPSGSINKQKSGQDESPPSENGAAGDDETRDANVSSEVDDKNKAAEAVQPGQNLTSEPVVGNPSLIIASPPVFPNSPDQYTYEANSENRDPFEPYEGIIPLADKKAMESALPVSNDPLLMYEIEDYVIVGIIWNVKAAKVMVREPKGAVYVLAKGSRIGRRNGTIHEIREGGVIIKEVFDTEVGKKVEYKSLALKR